MLGFSNWRVRSKLQTISIGAIVSMVVIASGLLVAKKNATLDERREATRHVVEAAYSIVEGAAHRQSEGSVTQAEAQQSAIVALKALRYDGSNYVWINDLKANMVMHPIKPELNGTYVGETKDPNGVAPFLEAAHIAQKQGEGFFEYLWPRPGSAQPVDKVSFVKGFAPWGWVVGSGIYTDDVGTTFRSDLLQVGLAVLLVGAGFWCLGMLVGRSITRPLDHAVAIAEHVAAGDLTTVVEATSTDETGKLLHALKVMSGNLVQIVGEVRAGTDSIARASKEIASGNQDLSQRTEQQASSLEETAASMEELTSTVKQNAENARAANQLAASASEIAVQGGAVVGRVVTTMSSINDSSKKIVDIISVIDGIAFQTNILALNAAVEAARAGEQGRGFAVVASEVRTLAQRSAAAAKEIKELISDSVVKVDDGQRLVDEAGKTMDEIVTSVKRVTDIMAEITAASQEQSAGIGQVNTAVTQMDEVTQQNAALVEEAAAAALSLQEQAGHLAEAVSVFRVDATADRGRTAPPFVAPATATPRRTTAARKPAPARVETAHEEAELAES